MKKNSAWSTEPKSIATVDKWGRVTALATGKATVTAKGNGFSDSVELNVMSSPTLKAQNETAKKRLRCIADGHISRNNQIKKLLRFMLTAQIEAVTFYAENP